MSNYTDTHLHIVMESIADALGKSGLNEAVSTDPKEVVRTLLPGYAGDPTELTVESVLAHIYETHRNDPDQIEKLVGAAAETLAEEHGVMMPMPEETLIHETNDPDNYFLARLRDRIIVQDMDPLIEKTEFYKEYVAESKLRDMNHLEDLVLEEGPKGLFKSIDILRRFADGAAQGNTTIKWDGSPAIVFGRDRSGQFIMTDKSGWSAKGYDGKARSSKELQSVLANRSPALDADRKQFIANMGDIFDEYEKATPKDFRGFLFGDLMYYNTPQLEDGTGYVFQPNVVRYEVAKDSKLGQAIGRSKTGIVIHNYAGNQYNSAAEAAKHLGNGDVLLIPPAYVSQASEINTKPIEKLEGFAKKHIKDISELFNPSHLKGIANVHQLFYKYINTSVDSGLENLGGDFEQWLNTEKLTEKKRANVIAFLNAHKKGVNALWTLIRSIMKVKDSLVAEFDSHPSEVQQTIAGQTGGEGYVVQHPDGPVKLVSRDKFTAANRALHR